MPFEAIINKYRADSLTERDKGNKFEKLICSYLKTKPEYASTIKDVWLWSEFPYKNQFGGKDTGIDIVCHTISDEYYAVQCKCYKAETKIDKPAVDTFLSTSSKIFSTSSGEKTFAFRLWIDTTKNGFNAEAENTIQNQNPPVGRIGLIELQNDDVDWEKLDAGIFGKKAESAKYNLRPHQQAAYNATLEYLKDCEHGKLIMACGTGKTFTALRISEGVATDSGLVLFLVPSIALLSQTLKEWTAQSEKPLYPICICSDSGATKNKKDGAEFTELALPSSTDVSVIRKRFVACRKKQKEDGGLIVVFSTYQSIDVISNVQKEINEKENNSFIFDLIVCDEAHRTTGVILKDKKESAFVKVHSNDNIKARKRIYMTATPRLYSSETQKKAQENDAVLCSMDDPEIYGREIYRIGFGEAVEKQLLTDYKVIVLTLDENSVDENLKNLITEENEEIKADDAIKLIGCINVLSKRTNYLTDKELFSDADPEPMRSAVAFCSNIKNSKYLKASFDVCQKAYYENLSEEGKSKIVVVDAEHVDGTMGSTARDEKLDWLKKADASKNECRILNNVRCLSEGVDVPSLDAIIFLSSRNSQVDVVQSVGRVMRKADGKKFGYIIIPVVIPAKSDANEILEKSDDFKIVWSVLNALRAHDDRFNATINKIELNKKKPNKIRVTGKLPEKIGKQVVAGDDDDSVEYVQGEFAFDELQKKLLDEFEKLQSAVYAKMVTKCGSRRYWADWGKDVGQIAQRNIERINKLIKIDGEHKEKFDLYLKGLKKNINPSITSDEAVEMLAQHIITKPVFEAIFGDDHFTNHNPVSKSLEEIVKLLDEKSNPEDLEKLERFYKSVQQRADGIDNAAAKQKIIVELYDSFFRNAFPLTVEKLGIVYTPVEVVDFIIHSAEYVLQTEFGRSLSDEKVNIIDPFTGTGTFITRLLQSGIIQKEDLERKYKKEIFANEIVLLAYYIASINIENVYHDLRNDVMSSLHDDKVGATEKSPNKNVRYNISHNFGDSNFSKFKKSNSQLMVADSKKDFTLGKSNPRDNAYEPFAGICFTDTFQLYESDEQHSWDGVFEENNERVNEQKKMPITVVMGNPPYSIGQKSANDNAQNQKYEKLENKIAQTYVALSNANLNKSAYDSYIKAFRWATDRISKTDGGIVAFVSNGAWLDGNAQDGFRKQLEKDFDKIYVFNLRGNQRTSGELSRKEGGKIFGSGSRTPIAITILVKKMPH